MHVLILEDRPEDAELMAHQLKQNGPTLSWSRVETEAEYRQCLQTEPAPDVILADYSLPHFGALRALELLQARGLDIPFIVITGSVREEDAVACMKLGASDYLLKDRLTRLGPAVESALKQKEIRSKAIQEERLRALGQMASGIAHDLNNALSPVVGLCDLLLEDRETLNDQDHVRRYLQLIRTGAADAADVVRRLREFYRRDEFEGRATLADLERLADEALALTEPKWKSQALAQGRVIQAATEMDKLPSITCNPSAIRELLTNLILNAVDAMPEGGRITVRGRLEGENVVLEVSDTGTGMSEEVRRRCFEPFFTTKGKQGTGLGLATVYGVVQRHRGSIEVESWPTMGTTFRIGLPPGRQPGPPAIAFPASEPRHASILAVDDEPLVREFLGECLRRDGHTVQLAGDGTEALELFRRGHFDLVITDLAMPDMSGEALAATIRTLDADIPIILLSGFDEDNEAGSGPPGWATAVLVKPVQVESLRRTVAAVLPKE